MGKFLIHLVTALIWTGVLAGGLVALVYFGGPAVWARFQAGQQAIATAHAQAGALTADTAAANRAQASCSSAITAAMKAQAAITNAAKPVTTAPGQPQPLITADQIAAMIQ